MYLSANHCYLLSFSSNSAFFTSTIVAIAKLVVWLSPSYVVSGPRDNPPSHTTLASIYGSRLFRIQVDSHTSGSFRRHDLGRFAYIEVDSPHKHSNRIAIGMRNKLNLNPAICACCYVSCVIFVWHSERVDSEYTKFKFKG